MKEIYKLKEEILDLYRTTGMPLIIVSKIIITLIAVVLINLNIGALDQFKGVGIIFIVSILVGVLPISLGTFILMCFTIGHVYAVSYVAAAIIAVTLAVIYIFGHLFSPRETYMFVATFIMCLMGGVYAVPLVLAMLGSALGVVPVLGGIVWYSMITVVSDVKGLLAEGGMTEAVFTVVDGVLDNRIISLTLIAAAISYVVASVIKNTSINESWKWGLLAAGSSNLVIMVLGGILTTTAVPYASVLIGTIIGLILGLIVEIFVHNVDYRGAEVLRFEDDEYCYVVKAVPKKDPPRDLEMPELGKAEKHQHGNRQVNKRRRKETPQEKRARMRAEQMQVHRK